MSTLSETDLDRFRERLAQRREQLRWDLLDKIKSSDDKNFAAVAGRVHDSGDESIADVFVDMNTALIEKEVSELRDVEAALARLREGTFGVCIDCGAEIDRERLEAYPTARRCLACQNAKEDRRGGRDATPSL